MSATTTTSRVRVLGAPGDRHDEILTPAALNFLGRLEEAFGARRVGLLAERRRRAARIADGTLLAAVSTDGLLPVTAGALALAVLVGLVDRRVTGGRKAAAGCAEALHRPLPPPAHPNAAASPPTGQLDLRSREYRSTHLKRSSPAPTAADRLQRRLCSQPDPRRRPAQVLEASLVIVAPPRPA